MKSALDHTLSAGELSISFPYSIHSYEKSNDVDAILILFAPGIAGPFEKKILSCKPLSPYITDAERMLPVLQKILQYSAHKEPEGILTAQAYLQALIGEILLSQELIDVQSSNISTTQKILIYCSEHYKEKISIKSIASELFVSESAVTKIFTSKLGYSFRDYINMLRIAEVKNLLTTTDMPIIDIMYECGYTNQSSFNRIFFKDSAMTPKEYRKKYSNK